MTGNIQSRRIAPKDTACGRCRGITSMGRRMNQNKCHTKKCPHFVLSSCRRLEYGERIQNEQTQGQFQQETASEGDGTRERETK